MTRRVEPRVRACLTEQRVDSSDAVMRDECLLANECTDSYRTRIDRDPVETNDTIDVDDRCGLLNTQAHARHKALTARQDTGVGLAGEQFQCLLNRCRCVIGKGRRLHR